MISEIGFKSLWMLARHVPAFILRRYFSAQRLAGLVYVDVMPRNDAVTLNLAAPGSAEVYVQIINLTPVPIQLDQAEFRLTAGSVTIKFTVVRKQRFEVGEIGTIRFDQVMQDSQARAVAEQLRDIGIALDGHIEFSSVIRPFPREVRYLDGIRARIFNENHWQKVGAP